MIQEIAINFATGVGMIAAGAFAVFLVVCVLCVFNTNTDNPRWMKIIGGLVVSLPLLTLLGFCVRMPA